jgi:hypothetical protein
MRTIALESGYSTHGRPYSCRSRFLATALEEGLSEILIVGSVSAVTKNYMQHEREITSKYKKSHAAMQYINQQPDIGMKKIYVYQFVDK